jgi:hypothetical protein
VDLDSDTWDGVVRFRPGVRSSPSGHLDPGFRPDRIWQCGLKVALNSRASGALGGTVAINRFTVTLPSPDEHRAARAELLGSLPRVTDESTLGQLPALDPPALAQAVAVGPDFDRSAAVLSVEALPERPDGGGKVWAVRIRFDRYSDAVSGRTARVSLSPVRPLDLRGRRLVAQVAVGPALRGAILRPNQVQLELEDAGGRLFRGAAAAVSGGMTFDGTGVERDSQWVRVEAAPTAGRPVAMGSAADGFDPTEVMKVHARFQLGRGAHELLDDPFPLTGTLLLSELRNEPDPDGQSGLATILSRAAVEKAPVPPDRFVVGINLPFYQYGDVGRYPYGNRNVGGFSARPDKLHRHFARLREHGIDVVRVFLLGDLRTGVLRDAVGRVTGLDAYVEPDIDALLAAATANSIRLMPVLLDFLALDNQLEREHGSRRWMDGEARQDLLSPSYRAAFIANALRPIVRQLRIANERAADTVWAVDIFNEPENAVGIASQADFQQLVTFVSEVRGMIRQEAPGLRITIGSRDRRDLVSYWPAVGDVHQFHFYSKHEEEDGLPLRFPAGRLGLREPVIVGEVEPDRIAERLDAIYESGYDGAFFWSYSGHDGYTVDLTEIRRWVERMRPERAAGP